MTIEAAIDRGERIARPRHILKRRRREYTHGAEVLVKSGQDTKSGADSRNAVKKQTQRSSDGTGKSGLTAWYWKPNLGTGIDSLIGRKIDIIDIAIRKKLYSSACIRIGDWSVALAQFQCIEGPQIANTEGRTPQKNQNCERMRGVCELFVCASRASCLVALRVVEKANRYPSNPRFSEIIEVFWWKCLEMRITGASHQSEAESFKHGSWLRKVVGHPNHRPPEMIVYAGVQGLKMEAGATLFWIRGGGGSEVQGKQKGERRRIDELQGVEIKIGNSKVHKSSNFATVASKKDQSGMPA
ncbi:hypothetical protein C8R43DRAFT_948265 [Mycena crocata]|nr:hypothetical protein C8R43DRAFT_948265 [Mycena crocata]